MIRIVTDSTADITPKEAAQLDVEIVPLSVRFPDFAYDPATDPQFTRFYELLEKTKGFPTTSQPSPEAFGKVFQAAKDAGDDVIVIVISSALSGTLQSAQIAKEAVQYDRIHLIDSRAAIMVTRILIEHAAAMRTAGEKAETIAASVDALKGRVKVFGILDTLTYLHKGGRLPKAAAIAGNLLGIKPIVTITNGAIVMAGKGRSYKALLEKVPSEALDPAFPIYFGYAASDDICKKAVKQAAEQWKTFKMGVYPLGAVVGAHVGPKATAVAFVVQGGHVPPV